MLKGIKVTKYFGGLAALRDVDFNVEKGMIFGIIGPNGSGKTTLFNCISGIYRPTSGSIIFNGKDVTKLRPDQICRLGIARTYQIAQPFPHLSALDNVVVGLLFGSGRGKEISLKEAREKAKCFLELTGILNKSGVLAKDLNVQERKKLELARALACNPKVMLLDEVVAGLNPTESIEISKLIKRIRDEYDITIVWVEHVLKALMNSADYVMVLNQGMKIAEGVPSEVVSNAAVIKAYLGETSLT